MSPGEVGAQFGALVGDEEGSVIASVDGAPLEARAVVPVFVYLPVIDRVDQALRTVGQFPVPVTDGECVAAEDGNGVLYRSAGETHREDGVS